MQSRNRIIMLRALGYLYMLLDTRLQGLASHRHIPTSLIGVRCVILVRCDVTPDMSCGSSDPPVVALVL